MSDVAIQIERLLDVGRTREADQLLQRALGERPGDPDLLVLGGHIAIECDDLERARQQLESALAGAPKHVEGRLLLFSVELDERRYAEAESLILELIREQPRSAGLLALYAKLMLATLHLAKARALVDEAIRIDPEDDTARLVDVLLSIVEGERGRVEAQLEDMIADDPRCEETARLLLVSLIERGRYGEALEVGQQLLRVHPHDEDLIDLLVDLRTQAHPLALPLWPMQKFGWAGSIGLWVGFVVLISVLRRTQSPLAVSLAIAYGAYVVYTWLYAPAMRRFVRWRGF